MRAYGPERYDEFFRGPFYEGTHGYNPDKAKGYTKYNLGASKLSHEDFLKEVRKLLADIGAQEDERYAAVERAIEAGAFLRRLKTSDNGSIPYSCIWKSWRPSSSGKRGTIPSSRRKKAS